jgi:hypothetical protein
MRREKLLEEGRSRLHQFALRERVQPDDRHSSCERVREAREQENVRGSRQQEPSVRTVSIDREFEREEDLGHALHFVQNHAIGEIGDEDIRVSLREFKDAGVIESQ